MNSEMEIVQGIGKNDSSMTDEVVAPKTRRRRIPIYTEEIDKFVVKEDNVYTSKFLNYREMRSKMPAASTFLSEKVVEDVKEEEETIFAKAVEKPNIVTIDDDQMIPDPVSQSSLLLDEDVLPTVTHVSEQSTSILKSLDEVENIFRVSSNQPQLSTSMNDDCYLEELSDVRDVTIKIRWRANILRFKMKNTECFSTIIPEVVKAIGAEMTDIIILLDEVTIKSTDTPQSVNLTAVDILDCFITKRSITEENLVDENVIELKLQSDNRWKKLVKIHMDSPMQTLIEECAAEKGVPSSKVVFHFDGETINPSETPSDLDLENGLCIDVKFLS